MPTTPKTARRRLALGAATAVGLTASIAAAPSAGAAEDLHVSNWASATYMVEDASFWFSPTSDAVVTLSIGKDVPVAAAPYQTLELSIDQTLCDASGEVDYLIERSLDGTGSQFWGDVTPTSGSASAISMVALEGTETRTPAGSTDDCSAPYGEAVETPLSSAAFVGSSWANAPGSTPVVWGDEGQNAVFLSRDAVANGFLFAPTLGLATALSDSTDSWFWQGLFVTEGDAPMGTPEI